jgi:hypothetical protein
MLLPIDINNMKPYFSIIGAVAFLSLCFFQQSRAQQSIAYIRYAGVDNCMCNFQVNSVPILKNGKEYAVSINEKGFDTLSIGANTYPTIFRLKNGEHYNLKCTYTFLDLFPVKGRKNGTIGFVKKNYDNPLTVKAYDGKILDTLKYNDTIIYRKKPDVDFHNEIHFRKIPKSLNPNVRAQPVGIINLIFLHGEKYTVVYDGKTGKINTTME